MKKSLLLASLIFIMTCTGIKAQLSFSVSTGTLVCNSGGALACVTNTVAGTTSYSWAVTTPTFCSSVFTPTGQCLYFTMPCNNSYSITLMAYNGTSLIATASQVVIKNSFPTISVTPSSATICAGTTVTLTASGASNYTWYPGNIVSPTIAVSPTASTGYSVSGSNGICGSGNVAYITVNNLPNVIASSNTAICSGGTASLSAWGANTYTWLPMNVNGQATSVPNMPTGVHCYTVLGANACGQSSAATCVTVSPAPNLTVTGLGNVLCPGDTFTVSASGASSYWWNISGTHFYTTATIAYAPVNPVTYGNLFASSGACTITYPVTFSLSHLPVSSSHSIICSGQSSTLTASGASSYTWSNSNGVLGNSASVVVSPSATTVYTVSAVVGSCTITRLVTVSVNNLSLNLTGPSTSCPGSPVTLVATGAMGYSWTPPASSTGSVAVVYPTSNTCYTVLGWWGSCVGTAVHCVTVNTATSLTTTPSQSICAGDTAILAGGAGTYTFYYNMMTPPYTGGTVTGSQFTVTPTVSTSYSVSAMSSSGCFSSFGSTVTVAPPPAALISGNGNICAGATTTLLASGLSNYLWSTGQAGPMIVVSPTATTCYTVMGTNATGCTGSGVKCVTISTTPLNIAASAPSVCMGSSATFTASGASTYTWNTSAITATINVMPVISTIYTVTGTGSNGCNGTATVALVVDTTCTDVWPGDANSDGIVGTTDVLELGYAANSTGPARSGASNSYVAQQANIWAGTISSGKNMNHADCNGDGTVNAADTMAIHLNFGLSHNFRSSGKGNNEIRIKPVSPAVISGAWSSVEIVLGDAFTTYHNVYGVTFDLSFDQQFIDAGYLQFDPSFLNASNTNIIFRKTDLGAGMVYAASVRSDHNNVSGSGRIATFYFKTKQGLADMTKLNFSLSGSQMADKTGNLQALTTFGDFVTIAGTVGVQENGLTEPAVYPNPAQDELVIAVSQNQEVVYTLSDVTGRVVANGSGSNTISVNTATFAGGTYLLKMESANRTFFKKIVVQH